MADDEYEAPSPTQAELNAMNRAVYGIAEDKPKAKKADEDDEKKAAEADEKAGYKTRQAKAD